MILHELSCNIYTYGTSLENVLKKDFDEVYYGMSFINKNHI